MLREMAWSVRPVETREARKVGAGQIQRAMCDLPKSLNLILRKI